MKFNEQGPHLAAASVTPQRAAAAESAMWWSWKSRSGRSCGRAATAQSMVSTDVRAAMAAAVLTAER